MLNCPSLTKGKSYSNKSGSLQKKKIKSKTKLRPWHAVLLPFITVPSLCI